MSAYHRTFRAVPTEVDGIRYDSKAEAKRAAELAILERAGEVRWWLRQVPVDVGEPGVDLPYRLDFLVCLKDGSVHGEDVKSIETVQFRRRVRQWRIRGPFALHVLKGKKVDVIHKEGQ